jgi:hypothetical protein
MASPELAACYRLYAAYCVEKAQESLEPGRKTALLAMAQAWSRLAEHIDKSVRYDADLTGDLAGNSAGPVKAEGPADVGSNQTI